MEVYPSTGYAHFFSYETKVSLELPVEWEEEEVGQDTVTYAFGLDEDEPEFEHPPKLIVKAIAVPMGESDAYKQLAQQMVDIPRQDVQVISRRAELIDDVPAVVDVLSYYEDEVGSRLTQYQALAQIENVVFSVTGIVEESRMDEVLPVFEGAVKSIRFILI